MNHIHRRRHRHRSYHTPGVERVVLYRRRALIRIYFGVFGIIASVALVMFRWGFFRDHANEAILGMFLFLPSYGAVVSGCWWWLKAKAWNEAVVFIAFMPLIILFIPYVRLFLIFAPMLLPCAMVMMPLILTVVVLVLPDKSGFSKTRPFWDRDNNR